MNTSKIKLLNTYIDNISSEELLLEIKKGGVIFTPNTDHIVKLQQDLGFYKAYEKADYKVCDSQILLWTSKFLGKNIVEKISGSDFFPKFYQYYQDDEDIKIFLLGGIEGVAEQAKQKINSKVNRPIVVEAYSPSIGFEKNEKECQEIVSRINNSGATVLAVGVGSPKQEKWISRYKSRLDRVKIFLAIGATIDFEAGTVKRSPKWMSNAGLEWLHRLILNPRRLWKRYLVESLPFFWLILLQKFNLYRNRLSKGLTWQRFDPVTQNISVTTKFVDVVMFGPCLLEQGGMGTVQQHMINGVARKLNVKHIITWNGYSSTLVLFTKALMAFLFRLFGNRVDIVHLHMAERGSVLRKSILALLAFIFSKPVIMHTHGCEFHIFYDNLPTIAKRLVNKVLQNCAYVIVLSKSWRQTYIEKCNLKAEKVVVKYNPVVVPDRIPNRSQSDKLTFLLLGKINQRKGVFDLLKATAQLPSDYRNKIELIFAGNGEIEKAMAIAKELKIDSLVSFSGWVDPKQRDLLLERANVFVLPSYNEGLPMALLEAMSWKLPVITTPVGGIPEIVLHNETGLLVEPGDVRELTASIQFLVDNEALRLSLGNAAYQKVKLLNIENYTHGILELYRSVLSKI